MVRASHAGGDDADTLSPFPEGWYFVASRKGLLKEKLIQKTWMGEEIVAWCDGDGRVCVADAVCPHLGSQLGPAAGGQVRDGRLVCPFHGFEYDATGQCVATPYAPAPRTAKLGVYATREVLGLVFAWWGEGDGPRNGAFPNIPPMGPTAANWDCDFFDFPGIPRRRPRIPWIWHTCSMCTATAT